MQYTPVIGLEIHVELNTKTKMFCPCSADYWKAEPNTHTCPICLGLPGALPFANKTALESCIKIGLALNCKVNPESRFERKNYFYPDLPKGYQISQYRRPLCVGGEWKLASGKVIHINRVHQEEDTAKLEHLGGTAVDFNRSGVPLVEMVTEPDFDNVQDVVEFAKNFQQIVKDLGVSNADMERGDLRLEANISLRTQNIEHRTKEWELPNYRVELKNINSYRFMAHALEYEIKRQTEALDRGETLIQETRGWNENKKESYLQRSKEEAHDYRYFPEPDIPVIVVSDSDRERIRSKMGELGSQKVSRLEKEYGILQVTGRILVTQGKADYFEEAVKKADNQVTAQDIANTIVNKRVSTNLSVKDFVGRLREVQGGKKISDDELVKIVDNVISKNNNAVENYKRGNTNSLQFLVGQVMKNTQGQVDANKAKKALLDKLHKI